MAFVGNAANSTENVFQILILPDGKGDVLRLITNRFDLSVGEISDIYQSCCAIELFFKWLKLHVKIKYFYGQSENAVKDQAYLALITYCLNVLAQMDTNSTTSILRISRVLVAHLWKNSQYWIRKIGSEKVPQKAVLFLSPLSKYIIFPIWQRFLYSGASLFDQNNKP